ncbi:DUF3466 family protein [Noviherbaspirillum aerium]|uniref:DUF3466 family protein n=1 Tax=Noviherbaspirillum aerium TaxID=2588497 RepID=UPI00178C78FC|nr:DUF3466 family protein [Noviherbaspirillum aerium]
MANVELLPANGYAPRLGVFSISEDGTVAWLDLDSTTLPNGLINARVSAFDLPAGQAGATEVVAMPARTWNISNAGGTAPGTFTATLAAAPADNAVVSGTTRLEVRGSSLANVELLPATGYAPRLGVFNISADKTRAWLDFDSWSVTDGIRDVRISAYDVAEGQPGATEIVAMPPRRWQFSNGATSTFTASVTMAPSNGATIDGTTLLEVRGTGLENVELLPASGYLPRLGVFTISADKTHARLELNTANLPNGPVEARISAFSVAPGQPNAQEIIAMPARQWTVQNDGAALPSQWSVTPVPRSNRSPGTFYQDLNGSGTAVSHYIISNNSGGRVQTGMGIAYADGRVVDLETLQWQTARGVAINNAGQIAGIGRNNIFDVDVSQRGAARGFVYADGSATEIPVPTPIGIDPAKVAVQVADINNSGAVVGYSEYTDTDGGLKSHAFMYANGQRSELQLTGRSTATRANAISDTGFIVGDADYPDGTSRAYLYSNGVQTTYPILSGYTSSTAVDVNDNRQIVGSVYNNKQNGLIVNPRPFIIANDIMREIPLPAGASWGEATAINAQGQVVGSTYSVNTGSSVSDGAFLYSAGRTIDLNTLSAVSAAGIRIRGAVSINNVGQILVYDRNNDGLAQYYLLAPVQ